MKNRPTSRAVLVLSSFLALAAFACSSATPDTGTGAGDKSDTPTSGKKTGDKAPTTDTSPTTPAPSTPLADSAACGSKPTSEACGDCCIAKNPTAYDAAGEVGYTCMCAAAACQTACAESICAATDNQNTPTAACKTCIDANAKTCDDKAAAACAANADCKVVQDCFTTSCDPIAAKENAAGGGATPKLFSGRAAATRAARLQ